MQKCKNAKEYLILLNYTALRYHRICKTFAFSLQKGEIELFLRAVWCLLIPFFAHNRPLLAAKARGEMLKFTIEQKQGEACLNVMPSVSKLNEVIRVEQDKKRWNLSLV